MYLKGCYDKRVDSVCVASEDKEKQTWTIAKIFTLTSIKKRWGKVWSLKKKKSVVVKCWAGREIKR